MSKRRRASSVASRGAEGEESDSELSNAAPPPSTRKKKKPDPSEICQQVYDAIRSYKKADGSLLCDSFIRAPKRRQEPQYYEVVTQPIDLLRVQQKLKTDTYEDIDELTADIELLVNNAKSFYKPDSAEFKDANTLWKIFTQTKTALENGEEIRNVKLSRTGSSRRSDVTDGDVSETSTIYDEDHLLEELFTTVTSASIDGRPLHPPFQFLPSKRRYPEYYEVIETPIDLKSIASKVQSGEYGGLADLERDLLLMVRNACEFNEPGSQIYKDAKALKKIVQSRKQELDAHARAGIKASERIRSKRCSRMNQVLSSAAMALLEAPDSEEEEVIKKDSEESGGEDSDSEDKDNDSPQWKLFNTVKNILGSNGHPIADKFMQLPSRRIYPDYYKEIKNPVALNQIRNKIRRGEYGTLSEVAGDMNIMFENAKRYNQPTSRIYKDAVKLQRAMQQRVQELLDILHSSSSDDESLSSVKTHATPRPRGRPPRNALPASPALPARPLPLRKKLHMLSKHLFETSCSDGRQPMLLFMEKPSRKLYPDYYNVIDKPIDMLTIEANIKSEKYNNLEEMVHDLKTMFSNCRQYNEEGSMIFDDANLLEKAMNEKLRELGRAESSERRPPLKVFKAKHKQVSPLDHKLRAMYDAIRDYRDPRSGRQLAMIFMKLPSKMDYPDYYELIKNPIDMERISQKLKNNVYGTVNELASDFMQMFDNACKYNEPDSQLYKDALVLQKICLQKKQALKEDDDMVPDVPAAIQDLLLTLFTTIYNHEDEEGRCYSDSMAELPEHDESPGGQKVRAISLDLVKRRLDRGLYKRLDHFQEDMFAVFERARRLSRTDSQVFEDSIELQQYLMQQRDELCKNTLKSPALDYTREMLATGVELVKQCKMLQENKEEDESGSSADDSLPPGTENAPAQSKYKKGDFVFVAKKGEKDSQIVQIERVWTNSEGVQMIYGTVYYRPQETFHVKTRRFLEQEVFKTDLHRAASLDEILGSCYVMNVKEYFKFRPQGFTDKEVFVCESRYSTKLRIFKKIKVWDAAMDDVVLFQREIPLDPHRKLSVFRERVEKHKDELAELEVLENIQEKERPDVVIYNPLGAEEENTHYEQYNTVCSGVIKLGDFVHVVTDGGKQMIAQIESIWETPDNKSYFRGPFLIFPSEVANIINKPFYKQEVLLTTVHDSSPLVGIVGKCSVLDYDSYLKCRLTEIAEQDVFICEALYDESNRVAKKLATGLRKFEHTKDVTVDEVYYFPKPLGPPSLASADSAGAHAYHSQKHDTSAEFTNLINTTIGCQDVEMLLENSLDDSMPGPPTSLSAGHSGQYAPTILNSNASERAHPPPGKKKTKEGKHKLITGYIMYASEKRKAINITNPEYAFGEISRIVGNEWRSLPSSTKQSWEERAARANEESARTQESRDVVLQVRASYGNMQLPEIVYECHWDTCDYQFEDLPDLIDHCIGEGGNTGHIQQYYRGVTGNEYACMWRNCARVRRGQAPFPNLPRLLRHVRDLHINKGNGLTLHQPRNFVPSSRKAATKTYLQQAHLRAANISAISSPPVGQRNTPSPGQGGGGEGAGVARAGLEPLFVSVPPRPQRVHHSEAYIRYIEGLHSEQKYITPWERGLAPPPSVPESSTHNLTKLPTHWLSEEAVGGYLNQDKSLAETDLQKMDQSTKILKAMWALRDFMMKDALYLHKNL